MLHHVHAQVLLGGGDVARFRAACARMASRFAETSDPAVAAEVAWICALVPGDAEEVRRCLRLASRAVGQQPGASFFGTALAAALYRAGRYEEAARRLEADLGPQGGFAQARLLLLMAWARLGRVEEARRQLAPLVGQIERDEKEGRMSWQVRVELGVLRREAAAVVNGAGP
jgi:hypothetical protein